MSEIFCWVLFFKNPHDLFKKLSEIGPGFISFFGHKNVKKKASENNNTESMTATYQLLLAIVAFAIYPIFLLINSFMIHI